MSGRHTILEIKATAAQSRLSNIIREYSEKVLWTHTLLVKDTVVKEIHKIIRYSRDAVEVRGMLAKVKHGMTAR